MFVYKVRGLRIVTSGPRNEDRPADPDGGIASPLAEYRAHGHRRLESRTYKRSCQVCPLMCVPCPRSRINRTVDEIPAVLVLGPPTYDGRS
jgi:hypothetical protein